MGMREPVLVGVVEAVIDLMSEPYPELREREGHITSLTRQEEERFLITIEAGMERFDQIAPPLEEMTETRSVPGREAFKLYDTYGFPLDLTQVIAEERGYTVDEPGFERALEEQRARSRADRAQVAPSLTHEAGLDDWIVLNTDGESEWVGWDTTEAETDVIAVIPIDGRVGLMLEKNPFYAEAGGQVSDEGVVVGKGWSVRVDEVRNVSGRTAVFGDPEGEFPDFPEGSLSVLRASAQVNRVIRHDTERNHTATHLLHAALRNVLGDHVAQRGSLVTPDRLRFDFSHPGPVTPDEIASVENEVNEAVWADHPVQWEIMGREEAIAVGAMALFGEKYGSEVRVVDIPGVSVELCGGTHLRHTGEVGLFVLTRESGVAAGVRRLEALTGRTAFAQLKSSERALAYISNRLKTSRSSVERKIEELLRERDEMEGLLNDLRLSGAATKVPVHVAEVGLADGSIVRYRAVRMRVKDADDARAFGDAFRKEESGAVAALATDTPDGKLSLFVFVTDDLVGRGLKAGALVREIAAVTGGHGGGRAHMAQGGIEDAGRLDEALRFGEHVVREALKVGQA